MRFHYTRTCPYEHTSVTIYNVTLKKIAGAEGLVALMQKGGWRRNLDMEAGWRIVVVDTPGNPLGANFATIPLIRPKEEFRIENIWIMDLSDGTHHLWAYGIVPPWLMGAYIDYAHYHPDIVRQPQTVMEAIEMLSEDGPGVFGA